LANVNVVNDVVGVEENFIIFAIDLKKPVAASVVDANHSASDVMPGRSAAASGVPPIITTITLRATSTHA